MESLINLGIFVFLLLTGFWFGGRAEKKHYASIFEREDQLRDIVVLTGRRPPSQNVWTDGSLVCGNVVISVDYFKTVVAGLRNLVGGNMTAYESLLDRARREAVLRMQQQAHAGGAKIIINTKFETSRVSGSAGQGLGSVEVLAYGTALLNQRPNRMT